jgi:hypothetical protein
MGWMDDRDIDAIIAENKRLKAAKEQEKSKSAEIMRAGLDVVEIGGVCIGLSYANARYAPDGEYKVLNVPVDLAAAIALYAVAFLTKLGKYEADVFNMGTGSLTAYLARLGTTLGNAAKAGPAPAPAAAKGLFGYPQGARQDWAGAHAFSVPVR